MADGLPPGIYEELLTLRVQERLAELVDRAAIDGIVEAEQPGLLARHVGEVIERVLDDVSAERRVEVANAILEATAREVGSGYVEDAHLAVGDKGEPRVLLEVLEGGLGSRPKRRPQIPLRRTDLLVNDRGEPQLAHELAAEIESADRVDLLCAFVKWSGLRLVEPELRRARERGVRVRVLTTTYMGATEAEALDALVGMGCEVRVSYEVQRTRLHAKAWLFHRPGGLDTGYVGSSNLSRAALLDGLEWNVRLSRAQNALVIDKFAKTFEAYWEDSAFEPYDPERDGARLRAALQQTKTTTSLVGFDIRPFPFQQEILDRLDVERLVHGRWRNLVVAATGTGKTVISALDYRRLCEQLDRPLSLLFVAHRQRILEQSLRTFREIVGRSDFGELYVGGLRPHEWSHVFASIQSLQNAVDGLRPDEFDVVIVDEFHHASAPTYSRLLERLTPRVLLGLTATPERMDGRDVREWFDGHVAAELRVWEALERDLLCPFHYFGTTDDTDLSTIGWSRGRYDDAGLSGLYTGNEARARIVLRQLQKLVRDPSAMRALAFCVSRAHAGWMAAWLSGHGLASVALDAETPEDERRRAIERLRAGELQVICSVDLFNEGVDIPEVDTVMLLRPTESATVFLQQLGRGLRHAPDKSCLTVLDFVGLHRKEFRFDTRYTALTGIPRGRLEQAVKDDFPFLPSGCHVELDRVVKDQVLARLKQLVTPRRTELVAEVRSVGSSSLAEWLEGSGRAIGDVYASKRSWTLLRYEAGLLSTPISDDELKLLPRLHKLLGVDDLERADTWRAWLVEDRPPKVGPLALREQRLAAMLVFNVWNDGGGHASIDEALDTLWRCSLWREEAVEVLDIQRDRVPRQPVALDPHFADCPLWVHASYSREELLAGLGYATMSRTPRGDQTGVRYVEDLAADVFTSTINKTPGRYSPTTMYRDYPISIDRFHWESQNTTAVDSRVGQRYLTHSHVGGWVLLFARSEEKDAVGTAPFLFLGPATYESHEGSRPISIVWRLHHPLPRDWFAETGVLAG